MENTLSVTLMIAFLLIGAVGGAVLAPEKTEIEYVDKEVFVDVPVETIVEISAPNQLDLALLAFLDAVEDDDINFDYLGDYKFDEFEVYRIYDAYTVAYDDEFTNVDFKVKVRFDQDDMPSEKVVHNVTVIFEEGEDTEVTVPQFTLS